MISGSPKIFKIFFYICICLLISSSVLSQNKFSVGIKGDLYSFPVSGIAKEFGPGYYDVSGKAKINEAFYLECIYWVHKNIGFTIGTGIRSYNYQTNFIITDPVSGRPDIFNETRVIKAVSWSPILGVIFRKGSLSFGLNVAEFDPIKTDNSVGSSSATHLIFDESQTTPILILNIDEKIQIVGDPAAYKMLQFSIKKSITKNIYFHIGYEFSLNSGELYHYRLLIKEIKDTNPAEEITRNDFRLTTKYNALTLGVGYAFNFGKYKIKEKQQVNSNKGSRYD